MSTEPRLRRPLDHLRGLVLLAALGATLPRSADAQVVLVDQGTFAVTIAGERAGTEEFSIRRTGIGDAATFLARGAFTPTGGSQELTTILSASAPAGAAAGYNLKLSGPSEIQITMNRIAGAPRFDSRFESDEGEERREFRARPGTRIVERHVAHHFHFLGNVEDGESVNVIEPRSRAARSLLAGPSEPDRITLGSLRIDTRRVAFTSAEGETLVWFDQQGRVLRVEVPTAAYLAEREDLVG